MSSEPTQPKRDSAEPTEGEKAVRPRGEKTRRSPLFITLQVLAVVSVLGLHAWERGAEADATSYSSRHFYPRDFAISLSIMLDRGFDVLRLGDPAAEPIRRFLSLESQQLDADDLAGFDRVDRASPDFDSRPRGQVSHRTSRTLDLYVAAGLWKIFGIDWRVYTTFYVVVSTLCCLLIFYSVRRISGSFACGLIAAILFALSPYETRNAIYSVRDINPLWFTIIAFWAVVCVADRFRSRWANGVSYVGAGAATTIGFGWRPDVAVLAPVIVATLVAIMWWKRRRWWHIGIAVVLFGVGARAPLMLIDSLIMDETPRGSPLAFLHVAYYGDATRSNLLDYENSFQVLRKDELVFSLARELNAKDSLENPKGPIVGTPSYGGLVLRLWDDMAIYHLFDWIVAIPRVCIESFVGVASLNGKGFAQWLPWAAAIGACFGALVYRPSAPIVLSLSAFVVYYGVIYLVILPEAKHLGPLVYPLVVLGALGLWSPFAIAGGSAWPPDEETRALNWRWVLASSVVIVALCAVAVPVAHRLSHAKRQEYLSAIRASLATGVDEPDAIVDPRVVSRVVTFSETEHAGYVLDIVAGEEAGELVLRNRLDEHGLAFAWETRHALKPGVQQRFFWSSYPGWRQYGSRGAHYTVLVTGDAEIVRARRLDLTTWSGLPFATVFTDDDDYAGSPPLDQGPALRPIGRDGWNEWGLGFAETWGTKLGSPSSVVRTSSDPQGQVSPHEGVQSRVDAEGTWIVADAAPGRYTARFGSFTAPVAGRYVFTADTTIVRGDYAFGLLSGDESRWLPLAGSGRQAVGGADASFVLCDLDAGQQVMPTIMNPQSHVESEYCIRGLEIRRLEGGG